jgi:hypothetical protein
MGFFAFIFVFLLGGVVSLVGAAFAIHYTLLVVERKTDSQRQKLAKEVSAEESVHSHPRPLVCFRTCVLVHLADSDYALLGFCIPLSSKGRFSC